MFELSLEGKGIAKIRRWLNTQNILRPTAYAVKQGFVGYDRYSKSDEENRYIWRENSVRDILRSPIYAGQMDYKRITVSIKSKKRPLACLRNEKRLKIHTRELLVVRFLILYNGLSQADVAKTKVAMTTYCSSHTTEARDLHNIVLADINYYASLVLKDPKATNIIQVTERNFVVMSERYQNEQGIADKGVADFFTLVSQYNVITELTAATINALIDKIVVSERKKNDNDVTEQSIKIYYKFVGSLHELYIAVQKRTQYFTEKECARCGKPFVPGSGVALYCPKCREKMAFANIHNR